MVLTKQAKRQFHPVFNNFAFVFSNTVPAFGVLLQNFHSICRILSGNPEMWRLLMDILLESVPKNLPKNLLFHVYNQNQNNKPIHACLSEVLCFLYSFYIAISLISRSGSISFWFKGILQIEAHVFNIVFISRYTKIFKILLK